jgi:hypothetical protein
METGEEAEDNRRDGSSHRAQRRVRGTEEKMEKAIKRIIRPSLKIGEKCDYARPAIARYRKCRRLTRNSMH